MKRFFHPGTLSLKDTITLSKEEQHHARRVIRIQDGDEIEIVNGKGFLAVGLFGDRIKITSLTFHPNERRKILIQAMPELAHLEMIIQKCTEIGIDEFWIFPSHKSKLQKISENKQKRLQGICISAMKQCGRLHLPPINYFPQLEKLPSPPKNLYIADFAGTKPSTDTSQNKAIFVGPESGFTEKERAYITNHLSAKPIRLCKNILRCETAAIISSYTIV